MRIARVRRPRTIRYLQAPASVKDLAGAREAFTEITWRHGTKTGPANPGGRMRSRFTAVRVRPATRPAHFEGRTWQGWHHHTTLVTAAHLFVTTLRLTADPKAHGAA